MAVTTYEILSRLKEDLAILKREQDKVNRLISEVGSRSPDFPNWKLKYAVLDAQTTLLRYEISKIESMIRKDAYHAERRPNNLLQEGDPDPDR